MEIPAGRFPWFDYLTSEPPKAHAFFKSLLGWESPTYLLPNNTKYTMIAVAGQTIGGYAPPIAGTPIYRYSEPYSRWLPYLQVPNGHETAVKVKTLGGKVVRELTPTGHGGRLAIAEDQNGQVVGVWQPDSVESDPGWAGPPYTFCWCELYTPQPTAAARFVKQIGGFTETKSQLPDGPYHLFERDGAPRAGARQPMQGTQAGWFPWVRVPDIFATVARALQLDATIIVPPADMGASKMALLVDPYGASLGLVQ